MASIISFVNRLLPFATPGTPLIQDLIHLGVLCVLLYFAPQIQEYLQRKGEGNDETTRTGPPEAGTPQAEELNDGAAQDREFDMADDTNDNEAEQVAMPDEAGANDAAFQAFQQNQINEARAAGNADAGPANLPAQRNVGAKKAKSLARRDQRRAYHEFQRAQGEAQRAKDAEGATEREEAQIAERERRQRVEAELEAKKAKEREKKREQERRQREEEQARRERAVEIVRQGLEHRRMYNLFDVVKELGGADVDEIWVERILNASGMLGKREDGSLTFVTKTGWVVKVCPDDMRQAYEKAVEDGVGDAKGRIGHEELGVVLEQVLKNSSSIAAH